MENASKALLIAGAVLIVIVLISIGVLLINGTREGSVGAAENTSNVMKTTSEQGVNEIANLSNGLFH